MNILTKATVLVLNRNWQAINVRTPQEAFCMMATNVATGLEIEGEDHIPPQKSKSKSERPRNAKMSVSGRNSPANTKTRVAADRSVDQRCASSR